MIVSNYIQPFQVVLATLLSLGNHRVASQTPSASYNIADLIDGVSGAAYNGAGGFDYAGVAVSSGGDFNGDGIDDFLIQTGSQQDQIYAVFGNSTMSPSFNLGNLDGTNGFAFNTQTTNFGSFIASGCDVNHDGFDDLIIGAPFADPNALSRAGQVYVLYGSNTTIWQPSFGFNDLMDNGFAIDGFIQDDQVGASVACAGDVNGDGIDDFAFAATGYDDADAPRKSRVYVVWGSEDLGSSRLDLANLDGTNGFVLLNDMEDTFGNLYVVSSGGDANDDGFSDIVLGDSFLGKVFVLFGSNLDWTSPFSLSELNGANGFTLDGFAAANSDQMSLASDGDVNGDDISDIVIGTPYSRSDRGDVFVVFGANGTWPSTFSVSALDGTNGFVIPGNADGGETGYSVASGGDVNGDGVNDLLIGAPFAFGANRNRGIVHAIYGSRTWASNFSLSDLDGDNGFMLNSINLGDSAGRSVASGGDVNGDGVNDIVIGAANADADSNRFDSGQVYIIYGVAPPPSPTQAPTTTPLPSSLPTTSAPTSTPLPTFSPTTEAPTTQAPSTQAPTTQAPTTTTTPAPTTQSPTTPAPSTQSPTTPAPTTQAPTNQAPTTQAPTTPAPTTQPPTTITESPAPTGHEVCFQKSCCEAECCGNGTTWSPRLGCFKNSSSTGWDGKPLEEPGCAERLCCEADCCGRRTTFNSTAAECEPN